MNRRKIENWVIFGLKLLPFLMLILFAVYIHRHDIPESITFETGIELLPPEDGFLYEPQIITVDNVVITAASQNTGVYSFTANGETFTIYFEPETQNFIGNVPSSVGSNSGSVVQINTSFTIVKPTNNPLYALIYLEQPILETFSEPLQVIGISFNNYLDIFVNTDIFNINDFYNWTVNSWFNGNVPVFYKPVFLILIYELIIDLLILLYSFITFVIKFAEKWLNGIYNKEW